APIGPYFEAGAIARPRIGTHRPRYARDRSRRVARMIAVVEHDLEVPRRRKRRLGTCLPPVGEVRSSVAVQDALQIATRLARSVRSILLVRRGLRHAVVVLGEVRVQDDVPLVVERAAQQVGEDLAGVVWVVDATCVVESVEARDVVAADRAEVADSGIDAR